MLDTLSYTSPKRIKKTLFRLSCVGDTGMVKGTQASGKKRHAWALFDRVANY